MRFKPVVATVLLLIMVAASGLTSGATQLQSAAHISREHRNVVNQWLRTKPSLRVAVEADCTNKPGLAATRQENGSRYHPYYAVGDFNRDGQTDFAVALINDARHSRRFAIAVFNGPFDATRLAAPNFFTEGADLRDGGLVVLTGDRLVAGVFQSDDCVRIVPRGRSYSMRNCT